ncbi:MAG: hypothetical protein U5N85_04855 [Arcicella sp.]|nr:hypothetical protein [Arcicella sp.]
MKTAITSLIKSLRNYQESGREFKVLVGFDGYVDKIQKVVKSKSGTTSVYYDTITQIADYVATLAGVSGQIEIRNLELKLGGNAPIMANSLGALGIKNTCIGTMGYPDLNNVFEEMNPNCKVISIAEPAQTNALEFNDGKIILSEVSTFEQLTWTYVSAVAGMDNLTKWIYESQLVAFVDWANLNYCTDIWQGILEDIIVNLNPTPSEKEQNTFYFSNKNLTKSDSNGMRHKNFFFDLCDPSKRSKEEILAALAVISKYKPYGRVTLGINENEARKVYGALDGNDGETSDLQIITKYIFDKIAIHQLLVHPTDRSIICNKNGVFEVKGRLVPEPRILTGGGDNLNAGFCLGLLMDLPVQQTMLLGMANSGAYIANGGSPEIDDLIRYLEVWNSEVE